MAEYNELQDGSDEKTFEQKMLERVRADFADAKEFLNDFHKSCVKHYQRYFSAREYTNLKRDNKFPYPYAQYMEDRFVQFIIDKLFFKDKPCTIVPSDDADKGMADVKQEMFKWMDYKDKIRKKVVKALRDCFRYRVAVAQVDYMEKVNKRVVGTNEQADGISRSGTKVIEDVKFKGATVKRIDPTDLFFCEDKSEIGDGEPIMVRVWRNERYYNSKSYYFNQELLKDISKGKDEDSIETITQKRMYRMYNPKNAKNSNKMQGIEWQGLVDKYELYQYLNTRYPGQYPTEIEQTIELSEEEIAMKLIEAQQNGTQLTEADMVRTEIVEVCKPGDMTMAICEVVGDKVVVRLEETPFEVQTENIIVGVIQSDEDEMLGLSLAEKIQASSEALDTMMGALIENMLQSINAQHVINTSAIKTGAQILVNKAGGVIETNDNVNNVHKRIEQPRVAPDIYEFIGLLKQSGEDASSIQDILTARGEQGIDGLGVNEIALTQATVGLNDYLKSFEESFIEPLYELRDQINIQNLDDDYYVYGIVGDGIIEWKKATVQDIRTNVDFICESSTRESNRMIIVQQLLQLIQVAPAAAANGIPIRIDVIVKKLMENFNWSMNDIEEVLPLLKLEREGQLDVNAMLFNSMMAGMATGSPQTAVGQQLPGSGNSQDLRSSLLNKQRPQVGVTQ